MHYLFGEAVQCNSVALVSARSAGREVLLHQSLRLLCRESGESCGSDGKDYYLHYDGTITFGYHDDVDKNHDYLIWGTLDRYAEGPSISIKVSDKLILQSLSQDDVSKNLSHSVKSSNEELIDVFDFIIHHSGKREWAIASFRDESEGKMYGMVQGKIGASVASPSSIDGLDESNMIAKIHTQEGYIQEHGASGDYNGPLALHVTDKRNYENMLERSKNLHFPMPRHYVYEVPYRSLYQYNEKRGDIFRGKYNSNLFIQILR